MNTASSPTTSVRNFFASFVEPSYVNGEPNEPSVFLRGIAGLLAPYTRYSIDRTLQIEKHTAEERKHIDFASYLEFTTQNKSSASIYLFRSENVFGAFHIPGIDNSNSRVGSFVKSLLPPFERIQMSLEDLGFSKCAKRINYLRSADAIEDGDEPLSLESAQGFVNLMRDFPDLGEPMLGLFPQGTLGMEWRIANDKHLLIEPFDSERACFALIGPSTERGEKFRLNGRGSISAVIRALRNEGVDQWQSA